MTESVCIVESGDDDWEDKGTYKESEDEGGEGGGLGCVLGRGCGPTGGGATMEGDLGIGAMVEREG